MKLRCCKRYSVRFSIIPLKYVRPFLKKILTTPEKSGDVSVHMLLLLWITKLVDNMVDCFHEQQFLEVILSLCRYFHDIIMAGFNAVPL